MAVTVCPFPSLNDQVTTVVPCVVIGNTVVVVPVTIPEQALFVTGAVGVTEHSPVNVAKVGKTNPIGWVILKFCVAVHELASVTVTI